MQDWISRSSDVKDYTKPILEGEDSDGNKVYLIEHPLNAVDPSHLNILLLRESAPGALLEHFTFSIRRTSAQLFFEQMALIVFRDSSDLISDFYEGVIKTLQQSEEAPNGDTSS